MLKQKIKLMTDSVSDISKERAEAMGIHMLYFPVIIEGKSLREELDFSKEEFYDMIDRAQEYPSTAQLTPFEIMDAYEQLAAEGYTDLIYVTIGAGGSGTYANAEMARTQFSFSRFLLHARYVSLTNCHNPRSSINAMVARKAQNSSSRGISIP